MGQYQALLEGSQGASAVAAGSREDGIGEGKIMIMVAAPFYFFFSYTLTLNDLLDTGTYSIIIPSRGN